MISSLEKGKSVTGEMVPLDAFFSILSPSVTENSLFVVMGAVFS